MAAVAGVALFAGCADGASLGDWVGAREDGSQLPTRTRHYGDGTYSTSFGESGTWRFEGGFHDVDVVSHCWSAACPPAPIIIGFVDDRRTRLVFSGELPLLGLDGAAVGAPLAGSTWTGSSGGCCANGSPFSITTTLTLRPSGGCQVVSRASVPGPGGTSFACTWAEAALGVTITTDDLRHIGLVRAGDALGEDGYVRESD